MVPARNMMALALGLIAGICAGLILAKPAAAEKIALVVGVTDYAEMPNSPAAARVLAGAQAFETAGISTTFSTNDDLNAVRQVLPQFLQMSNASTGQVIVLAGKFAHDGVETFFPPADAPEPSLLNLYRRGLPLSLFISILHNAPAGGILALAPAGVLPTSGPNWAWSTRWMCLKTWRLSRGRPGPSRAICRASSRRRSNPCRRARRS